MALIYIASPYSAPTEEQRLANIQRAIDVGIEIGRLGHTFVVPVLSHYVDLRAKQRGIEFDYEQWMQWCLDTLAHCDALFYVAPSPGANRELAFAQERGLRIFYQMYEVADYNGPRSIRIGTEIASH